MSDTTQPTPPDVTPGEPPARPTGPSADQRIQQLAAEIAALKATNEAATAKIRDLEPWQSKATMYSEDLALAELGLTSAEARAVARTLHGLQPEDKRGKLSEWVAAKPPALTSFLSPASPAPAGPPPAGAVAGGVGLPAAAPAASSAAKPPDRGDMIKAATDSLRAARKGGDPAKVKDAATTLARLLDESGRRR